MSFFRRLEESCRVKNSLLCVGLDPPLVNHEANGEGDLGDPLKVESAMESVTASIVSKNKAIIEETLQSASCYKLNIAFYEAYGPRGLEALKRTIDFIPEETPTIIDAKRNDIGNSTEAYAVSLFDFYGADSVTVNPYMGKDSIKPYLKYRERGLFMLCRTTNPGSDKIQKLPVGSGNSPLYMEIARQVLTWGGNIGLVVGATDYKSIKRIREEFPGVWLLTPGIGAQGGSLEKAVRLGVRDDSLGMLPSVSRSIYTSNNPGKKAAELKEKINSLLGERKKLYRGFDTEEGRQNDLLKGIVDEGCLKFGRFKLKSGKISSYYLDLRRIISNPSLLSKTADAYAEILKKLDFQRIAAIPVSSIAISSLVSSKLEKPLIYPRLSLKDHGTGNRIEGNYCKGEKVVLIDDVITTGKSKVEAIKVLREAGLEVSDMVVLVNRMEEVDEELPRYNVKLHYYAHIDELIDLMKLTA